MAGEVGWQKNAEQVAMTEHGILSRRTMAVQSKMDGFAAGPAHCNYSEMMLPNEKMIDFVKES